MIQSRHDVMLQNRSLLVEMALYFIQIMWFTANTKQTLFCCANLCNNMDNLA